MYKEKTFASSWMANPNFDNSPPQKIIPVVAQK
jgi:hypothetical protein